MSQDSGDPADSAVFDTSFGVGTDFYRYVNAGWLAANPIPPEYGSWGSFHEVQVRNENLLHDVVEASAMEKAEHGSPAQMVGDYWTAGLDETAIETAGLAPLEEYFNLIDSLVETEDVARVAAMLHSKGIRLVFGSYVSPDYDDSRQHLLYVAQGGLGLPERGYYFREDDHSVELRKDYEGHIARMLELVGRDADPPAAAAAIMEFETRLASFSYNPTELRDTELTTNKIDKDDFAAAMPGFGFEAFLDQLAGTAPNSINMDNPDFFKNAGGVVADTPPATIRSFARWNLIRSTAGSLSNEFVVASFEFYGRKLGGQREIKPRWKRVLAAASADIGQQVSKLYIEKAFGAEAKQRCEEMVDRLLLSMRDSIESVDWMGATTRKKALQKLAGFTYKIGYPEVWRDYAALHVDRGTFVTNRLRAAAFEFNRKIAKLGEPVDTTEWAIEPHAVNAYFHPLYNEIVFPAGILQPPFFWAEADDATNFGAIGAVIGHEITHGFDDQGSKFDANGNLSNWWTDEDRAAFDERTADLARQYDRYEPLDGLKVNGELTLGENIADLGGVTIAFAALQTALRESGTSMNDPADAMSPAQRFFVSYATIWRGNYTDEYTRLIVTADPHSPGEYRCNGVLENLPAFAAAFKLAPGSALAKEAGDRIKIW